MIPAVHVRDGLFARVLRNSFYQLVEWGKAGECNGESVLLLQSAGKQYSLGNL